MATLLLRSVFAKKALMNPNLFRLTAARVLSSSSLPTSKVNPHGWKHWKDIPDSMLPKSPDPTNELYDTPEYKRIQKRRIWYQIDDGTPIYFKEGLRDRVLVYSYAVALFSLLAWELYIIFKYIAV